MQTLPELAILLMIAVVVIVARRNPGENVYKFFASNATKAYEKYAPYSFKMVREKAIELGQEFTPRQYLTQILMIGGIGALIGYFYFYSIITSVIYMAIAVSFIPYVKFICIIFTSSL